MKIEEYVMGRAYDMCRRVEKCTQSYDRAI
jgi:hypothetical protein